MPSGRVRSGASPGDASALLYAPLQRSLTFRQTRRYEIDFDGDAGAVEEFVRHTLLDEVSQELHIGEDPALNGFLFVEKRRRQ